LSKVREATGAPKPAARACQDAFQRSGGLQPGGDITSWRHSALEPFVRLQGGLASTLGGA